MVTCNVDGHEHDSQSDHMRLNTSLYSESVRSWIKTNSVVFYYTSGTLHLFQVTCDWSRIFISFMIRVCKITVNVVNNALG